MAMTAVFCFLAVLTTVVAENINNASYTFPKGFLIGAATASYQIEGGWNEDGKGENIWDTQTHDKNFLIVDSSTGDVACDSYHKYKEDVQMLKQLGVDFYRFSFSWSRIIPKHGISEAINQPGIDYYNNLITELLANGIQPMGTIYHWDLPQSIQDLGGWMNPVIVFYFKEYSRVLFQKFGDRIKTWVTINEPTSIGLGYESSTSHAPSLGLSGTGMYVSAYHMLKAHAAVYHMYDKDFRPRQKGKLGMSLHVNWCVPLADTPEYKNDCERILQFDMGLYAHPVFSKEGDYPAIVKERVANFSILEGRLDSRLPTLTQEEVEYIRGTYDFFGLNTYTTYLALPYSGMFKGTVSALKDKGSLLAFDSKWRGSATIWLHMVPWGLRKLLKYIKREYNNPPLMITENGYSDKGHLNDTNRVDYITSYMREMLKAIYLDGCNVIGYTYWSLMDNFEWNQGYTEKFGIYQVNFSDPSRNRTIKESGKVLAEIIKTRAIPERYRNVETNEDEGVTRQIIQFVTEVLTKSSEYTGWPAEPERIVRNTLTAIANFGCDVVFYIYLVVERLKKLYYILF